VGTGGGNNTFIGLIDNLAGSHDTTFLFGDAIHGSGLLNTFNLFVEGGGATNLPVGAVISGVANINLISDGLTTFTTDAAHTHIDASLFVGATNITENGDVSGVPIINVGTGVTIGFANDTPTGLDVVTVASGVTSASVLLTNAGHGSVVAFGETTAGDLATVTVSGSVVHAAGTDLTIDTSTNATSVSEVDLGLTAKNTNLVITDHVGAQTITTINGSASTGGITEDASSVTGDNLAALTTVTLGSGADTFTDSTFTKTAPAVTYNTGNGNDTFNIYLDGNGGGHNVATTVTFGTGHDAYNALGGVIDDINVAPTAANFTKGFATITDFSPTLDALSIGAIHVETLTNPQEAAIAAKTTLLAAFQQAATDIAAAGDAVAFQYGSNTYVYQDNTLHTFAAGDGVIQLTGIAVTALNAANFVHA
jgi:hypothetical protein